MYNPYVHAKRKGDEAKMELLRQKIEGFRVRYAKNIDVFEYQLAKIKRDKGISL